MIEAAQPRAHGGGLRATLKREPEDFVVDERLGFAPTGSGEHAFLHVEKRGANTEWAAKQVARHAGVAPFAVGYAGMKDRHAVTRQYFTVHLAGRPDPDWSTLGDGLRVLSSTRHQRKLPRGALAGNRFAIRLRDVDGDRDEAARVLAALARDGAPNYFGLQRFGRGGGNVEAARAMFAGARVRREQRGLLLSAARSAVFNAVLAQRVAARTWDRALDGDVFQIDGSGSIFGPLPIDEAIAERLRSGAIHGTGPLWGAGELRTTSAVRALEAGVADAHAELAAGLAGADLRQERRALRVLPRALEFAFAGDTLELAFELPPGAYATTVLAELGELADAAANAQEFSGEAP